MKRLFYILFCLALLGCQQQEETAKPADFVPRAKMVQILADVHVLESLIESNMPYPDTATMIYNKQHKLILEKYDVSQSRFYKTYRYYGENITEMDKLYEIILDTLTAREAKLEVLKGSMLENDDSKLEVVDTLATPTEPLRRLRMQKRLRERPEPGLQ